MKGKIKICKSTRNPECGWYIRCKSQSGKLVKFLHKDLKWYPMVGWNLRYLCSGVGSAPGYYATRTQAEITLQTHMNLERGQNMKKGDVVVAYDLSWAQAVKNGKLVSPSRDVHCRVGRGAPAVIVETGCRFPLTDCSQPDDEYNDTVIQVINTGEVIFTQLEFLQPAKRKITVDGKTVEISHESFEAFKKQFIIIN